MPEREHKFYGCMHGSGPGDSMLMCHMMWRDPNAPINSLSANRERDNRPFYPIIIDTSFAGRFERPRKQE